MSDEKKYQGMEILKTPLHGIYIPTGLCLFGTAILDYTLLPYMIGLLSLFFLYHYIRVKSKKQVLLADEFQEYELLDKTIISKNTAIYRFKLPYENDQLQIPVGHHLVCRVVIEGEEFIRYYTPINNKYDMGFFDIIVKSYKDGKVSKYFGNLYNGKMVEFKGPVGRMSYKNNMAKNIVMIAGGSGITPMLAVLGEIFTTSLDLTNVKLIFANETENDVLLDDELTQYSEDYPNFEYVKVVNEPTSKDYEGYTGWITTELLNKEMPDFDVDTKVFICGPLEMKKFLIEELASRGWPRGTLQSKQDDQVFCF